MKSRTSRFFAVFLCLGGLFGIGMSVVLLFTAFTKSLVLLPFAIAFMALYAWSIHIGLLLWTGNPKAWRWAIVLFASQIPMLNTAWLRYEWFTGFELSTLIEGMGSHQGLDLGFNLGAGSFFAINNTQPPFHYGINLFALMAVILLVGKRRQLLQVQPAESRGTRDFPETHS